MILQVSVICGVLLLSSEDHIGKDRVELLSGKALHC